MLRTGNMLIKRIFVFQPQIVCNGLPMSLRGLSGPYGSASCVFLSVWRTDCSAASAAQILVSRQRLFQRDQFC